MRGKMQALIFGLLMPVIPLIIRRSYQREKEFSIMELLGSYAVYTLFTTVLTSIAMLVLCDEGTSFMEKIDKSPAFVIKYLLITAFAAAVISFAEWCCRTGRLVLQVDGKRFQNWLPVRLFNRLLCPAGLYLLAIFVAALNFPLIFDNVLWGDEAYAANLIHNEVAGIFQVLTLEENHPPLYYLWLKLFAELFGYETPVYHLASYVPFLIGILLAVTVFRKHFGNLPAAFFVIISGLSAPCLEYNMEVRMYALAFLGMAGAFYCAYRIFDGSKAGAWVGIVFWSLVAAYSHYYALVAAGILMALTFGGAILRFRKKTWLKGLIALTVFIGAYLPWLSQLFRATKSVSGNWWMTEIETMGQCMTMIACGAAMGKIILPLLAAVLFVLFVWESSLLHAERLQGKTSFGDKWVLHMTPPSAANWSAHTWSAAAGLLTIAGTLIFAYAISVLMTPLVTGRYLYPLCAVTALLLVMGVSRLLEILAQVQKKLHKNWLLPVAKTVVFLILAILLATGLGDYQTYKTQVDDQEAGTRETLALIGEETENMELVNNGIMHIGWTVLHFYYPDAEIVNGNYHFAETDDFWYFTPEYLEEEDIEKLRGEGFEVAAYGEHQIAKYPFILYHMVRVEIPKKTGTGL